MKKYFEEFTGLYPVSKTLRFELVPQGKTLEKINEYGLIEEDEKRSESYKKMKHIVDEYHKDYIQRTLSGAEVKNLESYYDIYMVQDKDEKQKKEIIKLEADFRKQIKKALESGAEFKDLFSKELFEKRLPEFEDVKNDPERMALLDEFKGYTTYFMGFHENRRNMYSDEEKSTAISFRLINQNLPKYIDNMNIFAKYVSVRGVEDANRVNAAMTLNNHTVYEFFELKGFNMVLTQKGIDKYNEIIGGYSLEDGTKVKGINEYINEYNQVAKKNNQPRIGKLKPLFKIMLQDRSTSSFVIDEFKNDEEVVSAVKDFKEATAGIIENINILFADIKKYDLSRIYFDMKYITSLSQSVYGDWGYINARRNEEYDKNFKGKKTKSYEEKKEKALKNQKAISIKELDILCGNESSEDIEEYLNKRVEEIYDAIQVSTKECISKIKNEEYHNLINNGVMVDSIKAYLDNIKELQLFIKMLNVKEIPDKDDLFYGEFTPLNEELDVATPFYNKVRNYMTKKPYSTEKIKLNFGNQELLNGWDLNKEDNRKSVLLRKDGKYYLGIIRKKAKNPFKEMEECSGSDAFEKMEYKLLPGANKMLPKVFFAKSRIDEFEPSQEILNIKEKETFKKSGNFNIDDCHKYIDFFKESIEKHDEWRNFDFKFSPTEEYEDISGFYREVEAQGYKVNFKNVSADKIMQLVDEGDLFLFQIYNKDFSEYSKGTPNLHTLYWKMLFDEDNLKDVVYKLNGDAEVFYRKSSIREEDKIVHPAKQDIENKNPLNEKKQSNFDYDIIKDRRYTMDKFQFHVPLTFNFKAIGRTNINELTRKYIKNTDDLHIIGIDRGERHLLYVSVIDMNGRIVEQKTLNVIENEKISVNYHDLLDTKEKARTEERKAWKNIENIKDLKTGYLSQAIHEITELVLKYNAIIVMEDLNFGFKHGREKVEKQVYQKFEKMLIDKLNYLVDKHEDKNNLGGMLHAYQLTNKFESFAKMGKETGIIFYIPAWNTSKIDPATGFVNLFGRLAKYESIEKSIKFWSGFESIIYDNEKDMFKFSFDYEKFTAKAGSSKTKWDIYSNGTRIMTFRNTEKNSSWDNKEVNLTEELKTLFEEYELDCTSGNLIEGIKEIKNKDFHYKLMNLFRLIIQMRNSVTGTDIDYMISPAMNARGEFFDTRNMNSELPENADANGAYNIAKKGLWLAEQIQETEDDMLMKIKFNISNEEWLKFAQEHTV